ncbi:amidohydrolase [Rossellomorea aquimaris]|uniref:Peptidase M20 n=1 Tax=Rossellomorea aquimaris TaxID=189382 RepID=A0A1J6VV83_9BACI|nr:amidohydrolase [Rossellomorea aquimaris]OIU69694.1 peptidase M20 [Rossellomorea aquimaris]
MNPLLSQLQESFDEMVSLRRYLHERPEVSFKEVHTPEYIAAYLTELGIQVKTGVGGNGVVGKIQGDLPGKTVALRADFDALPLQDEKDVPYRSKVDGAMHACGHDAHTATLLVTAKILQRNKHLLKGNVVLIHQFGEEVAPGGAKPMIEAGCLDGVDAIFGTHLWSTIPVGKIGVRSGPIMAAADRFEITIQGKGGHGASPHETVDSIMVGMNYLHWLQQIVSRRVNPLSPAVVSVGSFHAGDAFNIIADKAVIIGTVRTFDEEVQQFIIEEMENYLKSICSGYGAEYDFHYAKGYPAVVNHKKETGLLASCASNVMGEEAVFEIEPMMGGEDFSHYLNKVPGTFFFTGAGNPDKDAVFPHHHPKFDIDEDAMLNAAKVLLSSAVSYLEENAAAVPSAARSER